MAQQINENPINPRPIQDGKGEPEETTNSRANFDEEDYESHSLVQPGTVKTLKNNLNDDVDYLYVNAPGAEDSQLETS
jgi:hypothetical protein